MVGSETSRQDRYIHYLRTVSLMAMGTVLSLVMSILSVLLNQKLAEDNPWAIIGYGAILCAAYFIAAWVIVKALRSAFRLNVASPRGLLVTVAFAYALVVLLFGGIYYSMVCLGDYLDAQHSYDYYTTQVGQNGDEIDTSIVIPRMESRRAFNGIEMKAWMGVEDHLPKELAAISYNSWKDSLITLVDSSSSAVCVRPSNSVQRLILGCLYSGMFWDCTYFSMITMATLGYGDVSPRTWYAKFAVVIQVFSSVALVVFALGMTLAGWTKKIYRGELIPGAAVFKRYGREEQTRPPST